MPHASIGFSTVKHEQHVFFQALNGSVVSGTCFDVRAPSVDVQNKKNPTSLPPRAANLNSRDALLASAFTSISSTPVLPSSLFLHLRPRAQRWGLGAPLLLFVSVRRQQQHGTLL